MKYMNSIRRIRHRLGRRHMICRLLSLGFDLTFYIYTVVTFFPCNLQEIIRLIKRSVDSFKEITCNIQVRHKQDT